MKLRNGVFSSRSITFVTEGKVQGQGMKRSCSRLLQKGLKVTEGKVQGQGMKPLFHRTTLKLCSQVAKDKVQGQEMKQELM